MTNRYTRLPGLHTRELHEAPIRLDRIISTLGPFPIERILNKWATSGLQPPAEVPHRFEKLFYLLELLSPAHAIAGRSVVDFGCGLSVFVSQAAQLGMTSMGIDTFEEYGGRCQDLAEGVIDTVCQSDNKPTLVRADLLRDHVPGSGSFDFATSMGMMEHIFGRDMRESIIRKMMQTLRPGGWLILICGPNQRFPIDFFHYGPRFPFLHQLPVSVRRSYFEFFAGKRNRDPLWLSGMRVDELEAAIQSSGGDGVYQLFPLWAHLVRDPRLKRVKEAYIGVAEILSRFKAEPVIVLAAQKR